MRIWHYNLFGYQIALNVLTDTNIKYDYRLTFMQMLLYH